MLGISIDSTWANGAFAESLHLPFPLLSDFDRTVSTAYGILNPKWQAAYRTTILVGLDGRIRYIEQGNEAVSNAKALEACHAPAAAPSP